MLNKRGISTVIATVLLLLLTVVAVSIVASFVIPYVENSLEKGTECLESQRHFSFSDSFELNCFDGEKHGFSVKASGRGEGIKGFSFALLKDGSSESIQVLGENVEGWRMFDGSLNLTAPGAGETKSYVLESGERYDNVEIYSVLDNGRICEMGDSVRISNCNPEVELG